MTRARDPDEDEDDEKKVALFRFRFYLICALDQTIDVGGKQNTDWPAQVVSKFVGVCGFALDLFKPVCLLVWHAFCCSLALKLDLLKRTPL